MKTRLKAILNFKTEFIKGEMSDTKVTCDDTKKLGHDEARTRISSDRADEEGYKSEEIHALFKHRAGYISMLTKTYNNISQLIKHGKCNVGDVSLQLNKFDCVNLWEYTRNILGYYKKKLINKLRALATRNKDNER